MRTILHAQQTNFCSRTNFLFFLMSLQMSNTRRSRIRTPSLEDSGNNLYVTGLSAHVTKSDLEKHFSSQGKVEAIQLVVDPRTMESRGFGFVTMSSLEETERCIIYLDGSFLESQVITVEKVSRLTDSLVSYLRGRGQRGRSRTPTTGRYLRSKTVRGRRRSLDLRSCPRSFSPEYNRSSRRSYSRSISPMYRRSSCCCCAHRFSPIKDSSKHRRSSSRSYYCSYSRTWYIPNPIYRKNVRRGYSRRSYSRSFSPTCRRSYSRSVSPAYRRSYSGSYSNTYDMPIYRRSWRRSCSRSYSPIYRSWRSYSHSYSHTYDSPIYRRRSRRSYSRSFSPIYRRSWRSYSRSYSPIYKRSWRRSYSRSYSHIYDSPIYLRSSRRSYSRSYSPVYRRSWRGSYTRICSPTYDPSIHLRSRRRSYSRSYSPIYRSRWWRSHSPRYSSTYESPVQKRRSRRSYSRSSPSYSPLYDSPKYWRNSRGYTCSYSPIYWRSSGRSYYHNFSPLDNSPAHSRNSQMSYSRSPSPTCSFSPGNMSYSTPLSGYTISPSDPGWSPLSSVTPVLDSPLSSGLASPLSVLDPFACWSFSRSVSPSS